MSEEQLLVRRIRDGTVIDHVEPGRALAVLSALAINFSSGNIVTAAINVPSRTMGRKDIVKVENRFLTPEETNRIALIAPRSTINLVKDYRVVEKRKVELPDRFVNVFRCPNPTCISNAKEPITPVVEVVDRSRQLLRCRYCSRILSSSELG